jgi:hypothetical protein
MVKTHTWVRASILFVFMSLWAGVSGAADGDANLQIASPWPRWGKGMEVGVRAVGRFGMGSNINTPPGDVLLNLQGHIWYDHIVEGHVSLGFGLANSTVALGFGSKINLFEIAQLTKVNVSSTQTGMTRGLGTPLLQNFMIFASLHFDYFIFAGPQPGSGLTYSSTQFTVLPGLGGQIFFNVESNFVRKIYLEGSASYMSANSANYLIPYLGIGLELR